MSIQQVMVVGSGLMGSGIAQVCIQAGIRVALYDVSREALEKARRNIEWSVGKFVEKGRLSEEKSAIMDRLAVVDSVEHGADVDLVIEAVFEDREVKQQMFRKLDAACPEKTLFATNTSAIPITEIAAVTARADRFLGLHFFSPVPMMPVVEVIKGYATTDETRLKGKAFVEQIGKEPIMVNRDVAGFVINRINLPASIEAMRIVEEGVATVEDIDKGLRLGSGRKMGIFETGDMVGLDVTCGALMAMYEETRDPRWYPPLLLRRKVKAGHLGKKTGKGWYEYNPDGSRKGS